MADYLSLFPMAPLGGLFVAGAGIGIIGGALVPRWRMVCLGFGFVLGMLAIAVFGSRVASPQAPGQGQITALVVAVALEFIAFPTVMPRLRRHGPRAAVVGILAIVGAHFLVMYPALGPLIVGLGLACLGNAFLVWRSSSYPVDAGWLVDGLLKIGFGLSLIVLRSA